VFHISQLRPFVEDQEYGRVADLRPPPVADVTGEKKYVVETLLRHYPRKARSRDRAKKYLVKWQGYPSWENTEEPAAMLEEDCPDEIAEYWRREAVKQANRAR
jgi:hypothetical protein